MTIPIPTNNRQAFMLAAATALLFPVAFVVVDFQLLSDADSYLPVHTFIELFSIAVAVMVTGIGWNAHRDSRSGHLAVLAAGFLAVALLDTAHTLSYSGMPVFVTPSGAEKAILFWLAARLASVVTLLVVAFAPTQWMAGPRLRRIAAGAALGYVAISFFLILFHQGRLPSTFVPDSGLTPLKIGLEYTICGLYLLAALAIWLRPEQGQSSFRSPALVAAALIFAVSELAFTLYASVYDTFNLLGHVYKVLATYLLYRAVFVNALMLPYVRLRQSEEKYRQILQQAADAIVRVNAAGRVVDANRRALEIFSATGVLGHQIKELIADWRSAPAGGNADEFELWESRLRAKDAPDTVLEINARHLASGEIQAIIRDITERKRHEEQLRQAIAHAERSSRAKSEFLANMSHELRTPLNAILGFSDIIRRESFGPIGNERYRDYAGDIHDSGQHLLAIVADLLDIARIESGQIVLNEADLDLASVIADCVRLVAPQAAHLNLTVEPPRGTITLRADERALRQILLNLLSNACKFTPAGGRVEISSQVGPTGEITLSIADTGIGIASEDLARVTEAFVQVESSHARRHQGIGLGLAIAKALTELHGGRLIIDSAPDQGTTVKVILPRTRLAPPSLAALA
ncbi:MASE3 domain-containing protein [Dongia mobilis]|nr:MASE3 domain-containing protein [Dongia mobilis]